MAIIPYRRIFIHFLCDGGLPMQPLNQEQTTRTVPSIDQDRTTECKKRDEANFFKKWAEQLGKLVGRYLANDEFKSKRDPHR